MRTAFLALLAFTCLTVAVAQNPPVGGRGEAPAGGRGRGGRGAEPQQGPPLVGPMAARFAPPWGAARTGAQSLLNWRIGIPLHSFPRLMFSEAAVKADALNLASVAGSSQQRLSPAVPKPLDANLLAGERKEVLDRLRTLRLQMPVYMSPAISGNEQEARKLFVFARSVNVQTIAVDRVPEAFPMIEKLAEEHEVNVAVCGDLKSVLAAIQGRGKRIGVCGDTGAWMEAGVAPLDALKQVNTRMMVLTLRDRTALGASGKPARIGSGAGRLSDFLLEMRQMQIAPSLIMVHSGTATDPSVEFGRALDDLEKTIQPVMARRVAEIWDRVPIKGPDRLTPEQIKRVEDALPTAAAAKPRRARKLLVVDVNVGYGGARGGHATIPAANLAIDLMGKRLGAWETVLSNDINNFQYDRLKQFDAVFLNNTVGMLFSDPEVRTALLRYVREGGGLAAYHGASHASMDWPEFGEMLGARQENARTEVESPSLDDPNNPLREWQPPSSNEIVTVKIDDPNSPLTVPFGGKGFVQNDEYYRFYD
ncbi:MAG: ThuA domain-containing protein, partial [Candidatus Korobacteraceae bacterium]